MCRSPSIAKARTICRARSGAAAASSISPRPTATSPLRRSDDVGRALARPVGLKPDPHDAHLNTWRRNCDAAVERSTLLESLDQVVGLIARHTADLEAQADLIEERHIRSHRVIAIDDALDVHACSRNR